MLKIRFLIFILIISSAVHAQKLLYAEPDSIQKVIEPDSCLLYGLKNRGLTEPYIGSFFEALRKFPELSACNYSFKFSHIHTTLNVRPTIASFLFVSRHHRKYIIRINNSTRDSIITLDEIPNNALIGVFGHELCHMVDYNSRGRWGIIKRAFSYVNFNRMEKYEKEIDQMTIEHGLGENLYEWSHFVLQKSDASFKYKQFKRTVYLNPEEIKKRLNPQFN